MNEQLKTGLSFGLTSATITTLGLMVGLDSGTHSKSVVLGGILTIAIADAFSDALGIHVSEEAENAHTNREVWGATLATFLSKCLFALTFAVPVFALPLPLAIWVSIGWGLVILSGLSYGIARSQGGRPMIAVFEHLAVAVVVIFIAHWVGHLVATYVA